MTDPDGHALLKTLGYDEAFIHTTHHFRLTAHGDLYFDATVHLPAKRLAALRESESARHQRNYNELVSGGALDA